MVFSHAHRYDSPTFVRCTGFVKLYAALSIGSADSLALAGGRSHDANPNNHAFVHGINIHGNHKSL